MVGDWLDRLVGRIVAALLSGFFAVCLVFFVGVAVIGIADWNPLVFFAGCFGIVGFSWLVIFAFPELLE